MKSNYLHSWCFVLNATCNNWRCFILKVSYLSFHFSSPSTFPYDGLEIWKMSPLWGIPSIFLCSNCSILSGLSIVHLQLVWPMAHFANFGLCSAAVLLDSSSIGGISSWCYPLKPSCSIWSRNGGCVDNALDKGCADVVDVNKGLLRETDKQTQIRLYL